MISTILCYILSLIFAILSGFHFYWLFGGTWGVDQVIPTKDDDSSSMTIPRFATMVVALGLLAITTLYLMKVGAVDINLPAWLTKFVYWFIPSIFLLRAIGDFRYVGFFKKIRDTKFAKADSRLFSPLCIFISISGFLVQFLS